MIRFILRAIVAAVGFWVATKIVPGVRVHALSDYVLAGLLLGIVNALVRPIIVVLTLPLTVVTLGLFLIVVNAIMIKLVDWALSGVTIDTFWHAILASLVIAITSWVGGWFLGPREEPRRQR